MFLLSFTLEPWIMLFFSFISLLLLYRTTQLYCQHQTEQGYPYWRSIINALSLSVAFSVLLWGYLVAKYAKLSTEVEYVQPLYLVIAWLTGFVAIGLLWRLLLALKSYKSRTLLFGCGLSCILHLQMLVAELSVHQLPLTRLPIAELGLSLLLSGLFFTLSFTIGSSLAGRLRLHYAMVIIAASILQLLAVLSGIWGVNQVGFSAVQAAGLSLQQLKPVMLLVIGLVTLVCLTSLSGLELACRLRRAKKENNHFAQLTNGMTDAMLGFDQQGTITFYNAAASQLFGWQPDEIKHKDIFFLACNEHKDFLTIFIKRLIKNKLSSVIGMQQEFKMRHKNGQYFPARIAIGHYVSATQPFFVATITNIQDLREQVSTQKTQVTEYQSLLSNLPCTIFRELSQAQPHWVYISDNAKVLTGFSASELMTEMGSAQFVENIIDEDKQHYLTAREFAKGSLGYYDVKYRYRQPNNPVQWLWEIGYCYRSEDATVWADGIILDISHHQEQHHSNNNSANFAIQVLVDEVITQAQRTANNKAVRIDQRVSEALLSIYFGEQQTIKQVLSSALARMLGLLSQGQLSLLVYPHRANVRFVVEIRSDQPLADNANQQLFELCDDQQLQAIHGQSWFDLYSNGALLYIDLLLSSAGKHRPVQQVQKIVATPDNLLEMVSVLIVDDVTKNQQELSDIFWPQGIRAFSAANLDMLTSQLKQQFINVIFLDAHLQPSVSPAELRKLLNRKISIIAVEFRLNKPVDWQAQGFDAVITKPFDAKSIMQAMAALFCNQTNTAKIG